MTFALSQEPATLDPLYASQSAASYVYRTVIEGLLSPGADGNFEGRLALDVPTLQNAGVTVSADGARMDVTYKLRSGVVWADGQPFTSSDVVFTWGQIMHDPKVNSRQGYDRIDTIEAPDDTTVVMHYREIYAPYATLFPYILPKHLLDGVADISRTDFDRKPIGTGPFTVAEFVSGDHITVQRNPSYRVKGRPLLDRIVFTIIPSRETAILRLKAGEIDGVWNLTEAQIPDLEKDPSITLALVANSTSEKLYFNLSKRGNPADPNVPHPVLSDLAVRRALNLATPKHDIIDKLLDGKAQVPGSYISLGWATPKDLQQESYDPAAAKVILDRAGWVPGPDGIRAKGGVQAKLEINTTTGDQLREQVEQVLVDAYRAVGVELTIKNYPSSVLFGSWAEGAPHKRGDFDIYMLTNGVALDPHTGVASTFTCDSIPRASNNGAGSNFFRFCDPAVDKLLDAAARTPDQETRSRLYHDAMKIVNDDVVGVWLYSRLDIDAFRTNVGGFSANAWAGSVRSVADWYVRR